MSEGFGARNQKQSLLLCAACASSPQNSQRTPSHPVGAQTASCRDSGALCAIGPIGSGSSWVKTCSSKATWQGGQCYKSTASKARVVINPPHRLLPSPSAP
eukprot:1933652-Amphidinium_carterae.1